MLKHHTWVSGLLDAKWAWGCYLLSNVVNSVLFSCILVVEHVSNMNHEYPYEHPPEEKTKNILNISLTTKKRKIPRYLIAGIFISFGNDHLCSVHPGRDRSHSAGHPRRRVAKCFVRQQWWWTAEVDQGQGLWLTATLWWLWSSNVAGKSAICRSDFFNYPLVNIQKAMENHNLKSI